MSKDIYSDINIEEIKSKIDLNKLSRDYSKYPLQKLNNTTKNEEILKEDLQYLFIDVNLNCRELKVYLNVGMRYISNMLKKFNIHKTKQQILQKKKTTNLKKFGFEYSSQSPLVKRKVFMTNYQKHGKYFLQTEKFKEKANQTKNEKYGDINYNNIDKKNKTCKERYGVEYYSQTEEFHEKYIKTCQNKYNVNYYFQSEDFQNKSKETCLDRFGVEYASQCENVKNKHKATCLDRFGVENFSLSTEFKTNCAKYQKKVYETKKKNGTFKKSKEEDKIYELLKFKFVNVKRQYNNILYSYDGKCFDCDFYIPELDLYIEYQGFKSHGKEPFDTNNIEHIEIVELYQKRSEEINFKGEKKNQYLNYIKTWTQRDPLKRRVAKENNLNWIEFFNMKEFMEWFNNLD